MQNQKISVIVPVRNGERVIERCIMSLLEQRGVEVVIEVLVVDNQSTDATAAIVAKWPVRLLTETSRLSSYAARNTGIRAASGEILAFTDSDCVASPYWLANALAAFEDPLVGCVAGSLDSLDPETSVQAHLARIKFLSQETTLHNPYMPYAQTANVLYRRDVFDNIGLFEEEWISAGDADLCWRMQLETNYRLVYEPKALVHHNQRSDLVQWFKQRRTHGFGYSLIARKYNAYPFRRSVRETYWMYRALLRYGRSSVKAYISHHLAAKNLTEDDSVFKFVGTLGEQLGRLHGSIVNRTWSL